MEKWLIGSIPFIVLTLWRANKYEKQMQKHSIESSLVAMVEGTQTGRLIKTDWTVFIPAHMRTMLYYPLTHDLVHTISTTKASPQLKQFTYHCIHYEKYKNTIIGQVKINIDYVNTALNLDLHYHNVVLTIQWTFENGKGWCVSSVEHN